MTHIRKMMVEELVRRNYSEGTRECSIRVVKEFAQYFNCSPDKLGLEHIRIFQAHLFTDRKLSPNTVNQHLTALRFFFVKTLRRPWNTADTPYPKRVKSLPKVVSQDEVAHLIDSAVLPFHRMILMTLYATRPRRAELVCLRVNDIDTGRMVVRVRGKGLKEREVMLSPVLLEALRQHWHRHRPKEWLFPGRTGHRADFPINSKVVWFVCHETAKRAGLERKVHPHVLRHAFATHLLDADTDLRTIQVLLGHSNFEQTARYLHVSKRHLNAAVSPLDGLALSHSGTEPERPARTWMQRPPLEVADVVRAAGKKFIANSREWITVRHLKVLRAIVRCRTAALGYHVDECTRCGYSGHSYNSSLDRHCPKCQANARLRWIAGRKKELLPVPLCAVSRYVALNAKPRDIGVLSGP